MASLIPGFEYDIFISYRQKDNKHDGWVTGFVKQLKGELESTFKEEVSVYFDINPHDGLLETHDVDASLEKKLKCLIFIPIISRTYCDPKSFAWVHEFKAFIDQASQDQFGIKVNLSSGNVANRILPVQIHDLDTDDKILIEKELAGVLRGIEFIYKSPGVNRPLLLKEDNPQDNLNRTNYRDQINKVANAVKEIITGLGNPEREDKGITKESIQRKPSSGKNRIINIIAVSLIFLTLFFIFYLVIPKLFKFRKPVEKSIAVLPFKLLSNEQDKQYLADGMMDAILLHLSKIGDLKVMSRTSVEQYRVPGKSVPEIGRELRVGYLLEGSFQKTGNRVRLIVQLTKVHADKQVVWADEYDRDWDDIYSVQSEVAQSIARELDAVITPAEKKLIEKPPTKNLEAYNSYLQGLYLSDKRTKEGLLKSIEYFEKSIAEDPDYALAYAGLADTYNILVFWDLWPGPDGFSKAKKYVLKALSIDTNLPEAHAILGEILIWNEWNWNEAAKEFKLATDLNPNCAIAHYYYSEFLDIMRKNKEAREQIDMALRLDPVSPSFNATSALYYNNEGKFKESLDVCLKTIEIYPDLGKNYSLCFFNYLQLGDELKAVEVLQQSLLRDTSTMKIADVLKENYSKSGINGILNFLIESELGKSKPSSTTLAWIYSIMGKKEETLDWLEKALGEHSSDLPRINNYFIFNNLRTEPRFIAILKQIGLYE